MSFLIPQELPIIQKKKKEKQRSLASTICEPHTRGMNQLPTRKKKQKKTVQMFVTPLENSLESLRPQVDRVP